MRSVDTVLKMRCFLFGFQLSRLENTLDVSARFGTTARAESDNFLDRRMSLNADAQGTTTETVRQKRRLRAARKLHERECA